MSALLQIENLSKSYSGPKGGISAVDELSLTIGAGEFVAVQGPSGCGKTTLLLAAGALLQPTRGRVLVSGQDPYALSPGQRAQFRALNIGFVFQQFHLVPYLDVLDNILVPTLALLAEPWDEPPSDIRSPRPFGRGEGQGEGLDGGAEREDSQGQPENSPSPRPSPPPRGRGRNTARSRALELVEQFGLTERLRHVPAALSTGERQRVALARALLNQPKLLLADEPTGNLDEENGQMVLRCLAQFARAGAAVLLVTHEPGIGEHADRVVKMVGGKTR